MDATWSHADWTPCLDWEWSRDRSQTCLKDLRAAVSRSEPEETFQKLPTTETSVLVFVPGLLTHSTGPHSTFPR